MTSGLCEKTVQLLLALNRQRLSTLDQLYRCSGIPKSSLHRMLQDLIRLELVQQHPDTHFYSVTSRCALLSAAVTAELRWLEGGAKIADRLTADYQWPVAIATVEQDSLMVRFSSRPASKFSFIKSTVGKGYPMLGSALGEVWLGHRPAREQRRLLKPYSEQQINRRLSDVHYANIDEYLAAIARRGYALRIGQKGESTHLAVPIQRGRQVLGSLGMSVYTTAVGDSVVSRYLKPLQQAAADIAAVSTNVE